MSVLDAHPAPPPSDILRAAQARLLARLAVDGEGPGDPLSVTPGEPIEDRYEFGEVVAAGGLGVIRRAYDRRLGRTVAVKELRRSDPDVERRFLLEAAITARLQHPAIVPLYDIGRFPTGEPYYCMKLVEGRSLEQVIRGAVTLQARLALLEHVLAAADAIAYAHRRGVLHRDLKPANILVGEHGETVVIDWGLAKDTTGEIAEDLLALGASNSAREVTHTDVGAIVGTLRYMPPEQARGEPVDARSDVFALGAVLFHVLAGRPPHDGLERVALLQRLRADQIEPLRPLVPEAPPDLVAIVHKAMSSRPADRYPGADALAEDLRRFLAGRLVGAHRYQPGELLRLWIRRHRAIAAVVGVSIVVLAASSLKFVADLRAERDRAEAAQLEALRRADEAVLSQARATLRDDLHAALQLLAQVDLEYEPNLRRARLIAGTAEARGAPDRVLGGPTHRIEHIAPVSDGDLAGVDVAGGVWRWDIETGAAVQVGDLATPVGRIVGAAEAPVWAALGAERGLVFRGDESPETIELGPLAVVRGGPKPGDYHWELSRRGELLAALGTFAHTKGLKLAAAYAWDLTVRPSASRALPFDHVHTAAISPDGAVVAITDVNRQTLLVEGDRITSIPELRRPRRFAPSGRYLLGDGVWSFAERTIRPLAGSVLAVTTDDHALVLEEDPTKPPMAHERRFALRSLATGEARWGAEIDDTTELTASLFGDRGGFAVSERAGLFALHLDDVWHFYSLDTGLVERTLDTGPHRRGVFLADGRFALAHDTELWLWERPALLLRPHHVPGVALDGSLAVAGRHGAPGWRRLDLDSGRETEIACLSDFTFADWQRGVFGAVAIDRRGRVLAVDIHGAACLSEVPDTAHRFDLPAKATAAALAEGEHVALGLDDGTVLVWPARGEAPQRWQLGAGIAALWGNPDGSLWIAHTRGHEVFALRPGATMPTALGRSAEGSRVPGIPLAFDPRRPAAVLALAGDEALVFYDATRDSGVRDPLVFPATPALAFSPSGDRLAVTLAGRNVRVLSGPYDPGREIALPEEGCGVGFLTEDELAVIGQLGSLMRVDLVLGEAALIQREWTRMRQPTMRLVVRPGGRLILFEPSSLELHAGSTVPQDSSDLRAWLTARTR